MASIAQSTTPRLADILIGREGQDLQSPGGVSEHKVVDESAGLKPGRAVVRGSDAARDVKLPVAYAADADGIQTTLAALGSASGTSYTFSGLNPSRPIVITQASAANWDATVATVVGRDANGNLIKDTITLVDGGGAAPSTTLSFASGTITIPAQSGDASGTIGWSTSAGELEVVGITTNDGMVALNEYGSSNVALTPQPAANNTDVKVLRRGRMCVVSENAAAVGDLVHVRLVVSGAEELGALRSSPDGSAGAPDAVPAVMDGSHWKFATACSAGEIAVIERV